VGWDIHKEITDSVIHIQRPSRACQNPTEAFSREHPVENCFDELSMSPLFSLKSHKSRVKILVARKNVARIEATNC
jgi:hypothetical protein